MSEGRNKGINVTRRGFLKAAGLTALATALPFSFSKLTQQADATAPQTSTAVPGWSGSYATKTPDPTKPTVYFTRNLSPAGVLAIYNKVNGDITGKVGIKLSTVEPHGRNILPRDYIVALQGAIPNSQIVECNVFYGSPRQHTDTHREVLKINGFDFCPVDIMDADGDATLEIKGMKDFLNHDKYPDGKYPFTPGVHLDHIAVGKNMLNYDSMVVYTHFKGHIMAGFGGSLKNIGIGCASGAVGKRQIHGDGWETGKVFLERMVESGKGTMDHFGKHITYINVLKNISVDCDCDAHPAAPTCPDIGIVGSTDILAADQAGIDLIYQRPQAQNKDIVERIDSRLGRHQLDYMESLDMGNRHYNLVELK